MNRLIDALLDFSHLAHIEPHRERANLSELANEIAAELQIADPARCATFLIAPDVVVDGDAGLLRLVLDNLLGNAWKYTGSRDDPVIEFGAVDVQGERAYYVRDNGIGFKMADAAKLFTPFQRLCNAQGCSSGFGVGLATVERIIRRHGGRVWAEGEEGSGAIFYFTLGA